MELENIFNLIIVFGIIWSLAINLSDKIDRKNKENVNKFVRTKILKIYINFPIEGDVFDYFIDFK